jgi:hypothetical protein
VIDSKENLQVKPKDEMVYYLQQHSTILSQISQQLSSIAPQVSIPSTPPAPFPKFSPSASNIRINVFWFMALIFSLSAALLAILVQQWVRDYMHVFQRYSDPLKIARLRQYLHEGSERWYMPRVAEAVPGLLHISLFLFFAGLVDSLLNINTTVGLSAVVPIGIGVLLYIFTIIAPIIYPQSPYQNSFSGVIWYLFQKLHWRQYKDRGPNGGQIPVSTNMAEGQMELAMEETERRDGRDAEAIRWLIRNLTEDTEMEQLLMAIPGSFNTERGAEVWKKVGNTIGDKSEDRSQNEPAVGPAVDTIVPTTQATPALVIQPSYFGRAFRSIIHLVRKPTSHHSPTHVTTPQHPNVIPHPAIEGGIVHDLSTRVARSLEACKNRGRFAKDDWRKHTRACIETTAALVFGANANLAWFGDIGKLLGDIGVSEKPRELSLAGTDQVFVMHWTCLSLVDIQQSLKGNQQVEDYADFAVESLAGKANSSDAQAVTGAQKIDETLKDARECLYNIYDALRETENLTEVKEILRNLVSEISDLEKININIESEHLGNVDQWISATQSSITHQITSQIPGVPNNLDSMVVPFSHLVEHFRDPLKLQFIRPGQTLKSLCSVVPTLRNILKGQGDADAYKEMRKDLGELSLGEVNWSDKELQRQLWRLQDLRDGCGFAFTVELFFLAFKQLLSTSPSKKSHFELYTGTFRAITSDWSKHKDSHGTRKLLLDVALTRSYDFQDKYPEYIVDEFLELMGKFFKGQEGVHINEAVQQLDSFKIYADETFWGRLLNIVTSARAL